jgi:hypothetical protein
MASFLLLTTACGKKEEDSLLAIEEIENRVQFSSQELTAAKDFCGSLNDLKSNIVDRLGRNFFHFFFEYSNCAGEIEKDDESVVFKLAPDEEGRLAFTPIRPYDKKYFSTIETDTTGVFASACRNYEKSIPHTEDLPGQIKNYYFSFSRDRTKVIGRVVIGKKNEKDKFLESEVKQFTVLRNIPENAKNRGLVVARQDFVRCTKPTDNAKYSGVEYDLIVK